MNFQELLNALKAQGANDGQIKQLSEHVAQLQSAADGAAAKAKAAVQAQAQSQQALKALQAERDAAFDRLGVSDAQELESLPPPGKLPDEAQRQFEARIKRAERERQEAQTSLQALQQRHDAHRRDLALQQAIASQHFLDPDAPRALLEQRLRVEGEDFFYETPEGQQIPLKDGAALLAKTKPHLVQAPAAGKTGSGFNGLAPGAAGAGGAGAAGPTLNPAAIYAARQYHNKGAGGAEGGQR